MRVGGGWWGLVGCEVSLGIIRRWSTIGDVSKLEEETDEICPDAYHIR